MEKKKDPKHYDPLDTQFADDMTQMDVVSVNEVTGMVARPPLNEGEAEGYRSLFPIKQPVAEAAKRAESPRQQEKRSQVPEEQG